MTAATARFIPKPKQAAIVLLLAGLLVYLLQAAFIPQLTYLGLGLFIFPPLLLLIAALGGILPTMLALGAISLVSSLVYGPLGWWLLLCLAPMSLAFLYCLEREIPFFRTAGFVFLALVGGLVLSFVALQRLHGGDLYGAITRSAIAGLDSLPEKDSFLFVLWRGGFLSFSGEAAEKLIQQAQSGAITLDRQTVEEFYKQISARISLLLSTLLPGLLTTFSISTALLGSGLAIKLGCRQQTAPLLGMPPFSTWYLPREAGKYMMVLALGYLLALFSESQVLQTAGQMMYNVFFALYAIQGLAYINFILKRRGTRRFLRALALALMYSLLSLASMLLGLMDQATDPRKLRGQPPTRTDL